MPIDSSVNDFVVKFANVNGSGSASANELFARVVLRMGVPVAPRNIFPSNIQGLPTWYEVRVTEAGYLGRARRRRPDGRDEPADLGQGRRRDRAGRLPVLRLHQAAAAVEVPRRHHGHRRAAHRDLQREYTDPRQRQLFKNIIYVGALSALLDIDVGVIEKLIAEQFKGKDKLLEPNVQALHLGRDYALMNLECPIGLRLQARERGRRPHLHRGQQRRGARRRLRRRDGLRLVSDHAVVLARRSVPAALPQLRVDPATEQEQRYAIVQAEDELASIGMVIGAGWNGARAFTATSGPGISLMQEFLGPRLLRRDPGGDLRRAARRPLDRHADAHAAVPTSSSCAYASHGDTKHVLLFPEDPREALRVRRAQAFDLADRLQTPIFVMLDLDIGMNHWLCRAARRGTTRAGYDRGKVMTARDARSRQGLRPLSRRRRRRHPLPHATRHASDQGRVLHPRHLARPLRALHRGRRGLRRQHAAAAAQVRDREGPGAAPGAAQRRQADAATA